METQNHGVDPKMTQTLNENTPTLNLGFKHLHNGHCAVNSGELSPNESENKVNEDLRNIHTKLSKEKNTRMNYLSFTNLPGSSQHTEEARDASCGLYYGIKSYLHHFYGPPDNDVLKSGEYAQGDDFRFLAQPKRKNCWIRATLWIGINLVFLGGIALLVGYLTPTRQAIVGQYEDFTVLDRWAVNFNYHLMMCQLAGLITLSFGAVVVVCSLMVANCQPPPPPPAYLVMGAFLPTSTSLTDKHASNTWGIHCIPLSGTIKGVQPQFMGKDY